MEAKMPYKEGYDLGRKAGIREVVERLSHYERQYKGDLPRRISVSWVNWQGLLEEWGIEKK